MINEKMTDEELYKSSIWETSALKINKYDTIWHTNERTGVSDVYYVTSIYHGRHPQLQTLAIEDYNGNRFELEIEDHPVVQKITCH